MRVIVITLIIVAGLMLIDILTGNLSALMTKTWNSTKMREGLFHKMAIIILIATAFLCDYGQKFMDLGFTIPITNVVLVYVAVMELGSIFENLKKINPALGTLINRISTKEV